MELTTSKARGGALQHWSRFPIFQGITRYARGSPPFHLNTSFNETVERYWSANPAEENRTYAGLCAKLLEDEDNGFKSLTAHQVLHGTAMGASKQAEPQADAHGKAATSENAELLAEFRALKEQFRKLAAVAAGGGQAKAGGGRAEKASRYRQPIPLVAPEGRPHWCSTHGWCRSPSAGQQPHTTETCRNPGEHHAKNWGPAQLEQNKAALHAAASGR